MKAAVIHENGPPSVLRYEDVPDPVPGPGEILIAVEAISLEGGDLISRRMAPPQQRPHVLGYQAAGKIVALGAAAMRFRVGDRVATFHGAGSHASMRAVPEGLAFKISEGLDSETASTVPVTFGTAHDSLFDIGRLQAGETVLIQGGAGGFGMAAIQLAKQAGATVIATSSRDASLEKLRAFGMDHGINYTSEKVDERTRAVTGGRGADLVLDCAGGPGFDALMRATAYRGRMVTVGAASGSFPTVSLMAILLHGVSVAGAMFGRDMATEHCRAFIDRRMEEVAAGKLRMPIHKVFPLSEAAAAHTEAETAHPFGRIILNP